MSLPAPGQPPTDQPQPQGNPPSVPAGRNDVDLSAIDDEQKTDRLVRIRRADARNANLRDVTRAGIFLVAVAALVGAAWMLTLFGFSAESITGIVGGLFGVGGIGMGSAALINKKKASGS